MLRRAAGISIAIVGILIFSALAGATATGRPGVESPVGGPAAPTSPVAGESVFAPGALELVQAVIHPDVTEYVFILPDGTLSGAPSPPISTSGNTYNLTADFAGAIVDERNGSVFDGGGFTLTTSATLGFGFQVNTTADVTVEDLNIAGGGRGFEVINSTDVTVEGSSVAPAGVGFVALESTGVLFDSDAANGSDIGFASNYSADVTFSSDYSDTATAGYIVEWSQNVEGVSIVGTGDRTGLQVAFSGEFGLDGGNFLSAVDEGVALVYDDSANLDHVQANSSDTGLVAEFGDGLIVFDSNFTHAAVDGVSLTTYDDVTFQNDNFSGSGQYGLWAEHGDNYNVSYDDSNGSASTGFELGNLSDAYLFEDRASGNQFNGLELDDSDTVRVSASTFDSTPDGNGTFVKVCTTISFFDDSFDLDGVGLFDASSHVLQVTSSDGSNDQDGFVLYGDESSSVVSSTASHDPDVGFAEEAATDDYFDADHTNNSSYSFYSLESVDADFSDDSAANASQVGFDALIDTGSVFEDDQSANSRYGYNAEDAVGTMFFGDNASNASENGLVIELAQGVSFEDGNVSDSAVGFLLDVDSHVNVSGNWFVHDANDFAIYAALSTQSVVYWNNFIDGGGWLFYPAGGTPSAILFDAGYPAGGNYWSNWTTPDVLHGPDQNLPGGDGIVDLPLPVSGSYIDQYPLTQPLDLANLTVTFQEEGLPSGTPWGIHVAPEFFQNTSAASIGVWLGAASWSNYTYSVYAPAGWIADPGAGSVTYTGSLVTVTIDFTAVTYAATFQATGLPAGTAWSVNVSGTVYPGTGATITVPLANGTYDYTVSEVTGYSRTPASGSFTVDASAPSTTVAFTAYSYPVTFSQSGLTSGTSWSVTFGGSTLTSATSTITFTVANGTYAYRIGNVSGYSVVPSTGNQIVSGPGASVNVAYSATPSSTASDLFWVLVALVVILAIAVVLLLVRGRRKPSSAPGVSGWTPPAGATTPPAPPAGAPNAPPPGAVAPPPPPEWKES